MSDGRLAGKVALVTAGGSGMGRAIADLFAREGAAVLAADIDGSAARETANAIGASGGRASAMTCDVTVPDDIEAAVAAAERDLGGLDIFIGHAGIARGGDATRLSDADWELSFTLNAKAGLFAARFAVPAMRRRGGGAIVFTSSTAALRAGQGTLAYSASKAAILTMVRAMALDHARDGIRVNAVLPGAVATAVFRQRVEGGEIDEPALAAAVPLGRVATPEEIAPAYLFLASDEARYVTGTSIVVDGGMLAGNFRPA